MQIFDHKITTSRNKRLVMNRIIIKDFLPKRYFVPCTLYIFLKFRLKGLCLIIGHVKFLLFRPRTVIYVENYALFTFTKVGQCAPKKSFPLVHKKLRVMRINYSIEVVYIWTIAGPLSDTLSGGFRWLSLVIAGYPWLSLVTS